MEQKKLLLENAGKVSPGPIVSSKTDERSPVVFETNDQSSTVSSLSDENKIISATENTIGNITENQLMGENSAQKYKDDIKKSEHVSSSASSGENELPTIDSVKGNDSTKDVKQSTPVVFRSILTNPGHDYWMMKNPVADKIFITDVEVDLNTITIRECPTEKGFFKEYTEEQNDSLNTS